MKANEKPATGQFESRKALTKLHVSQLQLGMYVSKLDRPWLETPFLMQGFVVESLDDIDTIASYCEHVWIDQIVEEWEEDKGHAAASTRTRRRDVIKSIPSRKQINNSRGVFKDAYKSTQSIMGNIRLGLAIDTDQAKSTVHSCVQEIMRDPATMLLVSNMREKDNYTAEHSLTVCILAIAFGRHLGFNEAELNNLGLCGLLHDIGKMNVPEEILNKEGSLEDEE